MSAMTPPTGNCRRDLRRTRHPSGYCQNCRRALKRAAVALDEHRTEVIRAAWDLGLADPQRAVELIRRALGKLARLGDAGRPPEAT